MTQEGMVVPGRVGPLSLRSDAKEIVHILVWQHIIIKKIIIIKNTYVYRNLCKI